jgi:uncharacterized protein
MAERRTPEPAEGPATVPESTGAARRVPVDCGDFEIRIARDGTWYYRGSPIHRLPLVKLFASVLERDASGAYFLSTPAERGRIAVDDAPFVAVALEKRGEGEGQELIFQTNLDDSVSLGAEHPLRVVNDATGAPNPYIVVRKGLEARLGRAVFYELVELACEEKVGDSARIGVWSKGRFFPIDGADPSG